MIRLHGSFGSVLSATSSPSVTPSPSESGLSGSVPSAISSSFVSPSLSQSRVPQAAFGVTDWLAMTRLHGSFGSVLSATSSWFVTPSPSQSAIGLPRHASITIKMVSFTQLAGKGNPSSQICTTTVSSPV